MNRLIILMGMLCAFSYSSFTQVFAQNTKKNFVEIRVTDQQTGFSIPNATIEILSSSKNSIPSNQKGKVFIQKNTQKQVIRVSAEGYSPIETYYQLASVEEGLEMEIQLDPILPKTNFSLQNLRKQEKTSVISGFVSDKETGFPVSNVKVTTLNATAYTDKNGFYEFSIPFDVEAIQTIEGLLNNHQKIQISFSKEGFTTHLLKDFRVLGEDYLLKIAMTAATSEMKQSSTTTTETETFSHGFFDKTREEDNASNNIRLNDNHNHKSNPATTEEVSRVEALVVPSSIRVGLNCSCNSCSSVTVMGLESYVEQGIDNEWIPSWSDNSLRSGAVAYRSYGANHVLNPIRSNYDISSTTCRQVWVSGTTTRCRAAAQFTAGEVLVRECDNTKIAFTEYSAENNNSGCGDGFAGTGGTGFNGVSCSVNTYQGWPCISDAINAGNASFGHGRGLSQWGSQRWASQQNKTYGWILDHYYNPGGIERSGSSTPSDTVDPTTSITAPSNSTSDFSATFTDADNVGVTGRFYQVLENYASETRANRGNGFYNDNFSTGSLHSDYTVGTGSWSANSSGRLVQSNTTSTNTSLSTFLSQTNGQSYLYNFAAKLNSTTGNRRFGIHIMASQTDSERGNSYLIWFSADGGTVSILETVNNVLNTRASASITTGTSWADYKVAYSTTTGKIEVFRNDALLTQWTDSSPLTSGSYISLRTNQANVEFDDLKVYKGRSTGVTVTVGNTNGKDLRTNLASTGQVKSIVRDAAGNFSSVANANITIGTPAITDITGNWAENEIRYMLDNGFMSGYADNTFRPNNTTSRAEFATMIAVIIDPSISSDPAVASRSFTDISGHWAEANILKAARAGYLSGYTDGTFRPNDPITRMQVTLSISNGLGVSGGTSTMLNLFTDKNDVPSWATTSVTNGIANRFVANHPDKNYYKPNENSTRANATVVMYQALRYLSRASELFNTYIVVPANPASKVAATTNELDENILAEMSLFPNPIENSRLNLAYSLKEASDVSIRLYSILGEEISILYQGNKEAGTHKEEFELSTLRLKAGTYIIKISSKEGTQTLRLVKL
ncbi:S-layer homology domain-containing protein [Bernardetia sp. MNP-M8]|uniref:S-layer homology domain-containing protein n=1 Tax=Bernardetia sp. MNP-M8 TaxID=3127470 RepID=UPI0030CFDE90